MVGIFVVGAVVGDGVGSVDGDAVGDVLSVGANVVGKDVVGTSVVGSQHSN